MDALVKQKADKTVGSQGAIRAMPASDREMLDRISEARRECGNGARMLSVVRHERKLWFLDERLKQLRNVRNPHDFINLNDFEIEFFRQEVI